MLPKFDDIHAAMTTLQWNSVSWRTLAPREFANADLNALADRGIFPEQDFAYVFKAETERAILPLFSGDREAFDEEMRTRAETAVEMVNASFEQCSIALLGASQNRLFFVYCFSMIVKGGRAMNPYFSLTESERASLNAAFRHMVESEPVELRSGRTGTHTHLPEDQIRSNLLRRWITRPDGSIDRNAMRDAILEFSWLVQSNVFHEVLSTAMRFTTLSPDEQSAQHEAFRDLAEAHLQIYLSVLMGRYLGMSLPPQDWYLEKAYPVLENLFSVYEWIPKKGREKLRRDLVEMLPGLGRSLNMTEKDVLRYLVFKLAEPEKFRDEFELQGRLLETLYLASLVAEFAGDICPLRI